MSSQPSMYFSKECILKVIQEYEPFHGYQRLELDDIPDIWVTRFNEEMKKMMQDEAHGLIRRSMHFFYEDKVQFGRKK